MVPRPQFISGPYISCPECHAERFGVVFVGPDRMMRRCTACGWKGICELPRLNKRLVFIDQSALSNMLHVIAPLNARKSKHHDSWRAMFLRLDNLVHMQLIACPFTSVHVHESMLHPEKVQGLNWLAQRLAGDMHFADRFEIEQQQVVEGAVAWLKGQPIGLSDLTVKFAVRGDRTAWLDNMMFQWPVSWPAEVVDTIRTVRDDTHRELAPVYKRWRESSITFDECVVEELLGFARSAYQRVMRGVVPAASCELPVITSLFKRCGLDPQLAFKKAMEFLASPELLRQVPVINMRMMLTAAVVPEFRQGRKKDPGRGTSGDIAAISTSLPFCDAMFVDNECARFLSYPPLRKEVKRYGCEVFSIKTMDGFMNYLDEVEAAASAEHKALVAEVYGLMPTELPSFIPPKRRDQA